MGVVHRHPLTTLNARTMTTIRAKFILAFLAAASFPALAPSGATAHDPAAREVVQSVTHAGQTMTMRLAKVPLRGPHFEVRVQRAGGGYETVQAPADRAFLGTVDERPGAVASGIVLADGTLRGAIYFDRGGTWFTRGGMVTGTRGLEAQPFAWPTKPNLGAARPGRAA